MPALTSDPAPEKPAAPKPAGWPWRRPALPAPVIVFGALAFIALAFAFVGLDTNPFDVDELFTLDLIDHQGGFGEVLHRALGDTHPPLYYFLLYGWTRFLPITEVTARLPSALLACGAVLVFAGGVRKEFSPSAIAFAAALGALSKFFFQQSQYTRDYGLALLGSAGLLACACMLRRDLARDKAGGALAAIGLVGLAASLSHAYVLLQTGMTLLYAMAFWARSWRMRGVIAAIGLAILSVNVAYFTLLMHSTKENLQDLWFENSFSAVKNMVRGTFLGSVVNGAEVAVLGLLCVVAWRWFRRRGAPATESQPAPDGASIARLAWFVVLGTCVCGIAVSLVVAPSMSERNLLTASPFIWALFARLYDKTAGGWRGRTATIALAVLGALLATNLLTLGGRLIVTNEDWRVSAKYIETTPGCGSAEIPAVQPYIFGPDNAHFRELARVRFYGRYLRGGDGLSTWMPAQIGGRTPAPRLMEIFSARAAAASADADAPGVCPVLLWAVHDVNEIDALRLAEDMARLPAVKPARIVVQEINSYRRKAFVWVPKPDAFIFLATPAADGATAPPLPQPALPKAQMKQVGDRIVVIHLSTTEEQGVSYDRFRVQRWRGDRLAGEVVDKVQRFTCVPLEPANERRVWPSLRNPGCSPQPEDWPEKMIL